MTTKEFKNVETRFVDMSTNIKNELKNGQYVVLASQPDGVTIIGKDGKNAFTAEEAVEIYKEHEKTIQGTSTYLRFEPFPTCLYVEDDTTKTFLTINNYIDFDKRHDKLTKKYLNIKWQTCPEFYYDGLECNEIENTNVVALLYHNNHQINEVGCDKEIKFMDIEEFITLNSNAIDTIGDFVTKHTADTDKFDVKLHWHAGKYLNEEDSDMFLTLIDCTTGFDISVEIGKNRTVNVYDSYYRFYTSYEYDCPVVDVYKTLLTKMSADVKRYLKSVKEQYAQNKDLRISGLDNPRIYNALCYFSQDFGIEVEIGEENREPYIDIIGFNE